jgi:hypothetical protein
MEASFMIRQHYALPLDPRVVLDVMAEVTKETGIMEGGRGRERERARVSLAMRILKL